MRISLEDKKKEAIERMKLWKIPINVIRDFKNQNIIFENVHLNKDVLMVACLNKINDEQLHRIKKFEKEHDALVYFVIHSYTNIGELENYLYVSDYSDEWLTDRSDIEMNQQLVYVCNCTDIELSEFGCIGLCKTTNSGPIRTW